MNMTLAQAAAAGVKAIATDLVAKQFVEQLARLMQGWFSRQGYAGADQGIEGDYLLNGNLGKVSARLELADPVRGIPLRVVGELRASAEGTNLVARLRVRRADQHTDWVLVDSDPVQLDYSEHRGVYKLQRLVQQLRASLGVAEDAEQLESTSVHALLQAMMKDIQAPLAA